MTLMLRNSKGERDGMFSCSVYTLGAVLAKFFAAGITFGKLSLGAAPDAALVGVLLASTLGAYVARKNNIGGGGTVAREDAK